MPPGSSSVSLPMPWRCWRTITTSPARVSGTMLHQSGASTIQNSCSRPVRG